MKQPLIELRRRLNEILDEQSSIDKSDTEAGKNYLENTRYLALQTEERSVQADIVIAEQAEADRKKRAETQASLRASAAAASPGLEETNSRAVPYGSGARTHDNRGDAPFESLGHMMLCVRTAAMSPSAIDPRLVQTRAALGANESVGGDGGFLVGKDVASELLEDMHDVGMIAPLCRELPISSGSNAITINGVDETSRADGSRWGGVQAYWADEAATVTATKPKFVPIELKLKKLLAFYYATDEILEDASALAAEAQAAFSEEMAFKVDDAIIRGPGGGQPLGILNAGVLVSVAKETGQAAGTVQFENIVKMYARMPARSKARATWFLNDDVFPQLQTMTIAAGASNVPVYLPPNGAASAPFGTLLGRPVMPIEQAETVGTVGDIILADFSQYRLATKGGLQQASSVHVAFLTSEQVFRFTYRVDGQPARRLPVTPYKGAATKGPFVVLATR